MLLNRFETLDPVRHESVAELLRQLSEVEVDRYPPAQISPQDVVPPEMWSVAPAYAPETYARFMEKRDDFFVVPEAELDHAAAEPTFNASPGTHAEVTSPELNQEDQDFALHTDIDETRHSSMDSPLPVELVRPAQVTLVKSLVADEDEDEAYPYLGIYSHGAEEADVKLPSPPPKAFAQELSNLPQSLPDPAKVAVDDVLEVEPPSHVDPAIEEPPEPPSVLLDLPQDPVTQDFASLYLEYRTSLPASILLSSTPEVDTAEPEIAEDKQADLIVSRHQAALTRDEGDIWDSLSARMDLDLDPKSSIMESHSSTAMKLASRSEDIVAMYERRTDTPTYQTYEEVKEILKAMGIPILETVGGYEAEALASVLVLDGWADYVGSEDTVSFLLSFFCPLLTAVRN